MHHFMQHELAANQDKLVRHLCTDRGRQHHKSWSHEHKQKFKMRMPCKKRVRYRCHTQEPCPYVLRQATPSHTCMRATHQMPSAALSAPTYSSSLVRKYRRLLSPHAVHEIASANWFLQGFSGNSLIILQHASKYILQDINKLPDKQ